LGCNAGRSEDDWQDINFFGNELTLHEDPNFQKNELSASKIVDMCDIPVPHFGIHLDRKTFDDIKTRLANYDDANILLEPFVRFKGRPPEQETMFVSDPFNYVIEFKSMKNPSTLWDVKS
jgi:extradiol dioxygenase family protein